MQTENPVYEEIQEILRAAELPSVALVGQRIDSPPALANIREGVREALNSVELPSGSVAIGVGSRGVARIGEVVAALVEALKESGADPFIVPAMGSHGASTAEGQAQVLAHLGVNEEQVGCPVRATMESARIGETPSGVAVYMDRNAHEADSVIVVNRVKPHTAFRGAVESGPTKMLAIGLGKQRGAHSIHSAGWENIHQTIPEAARVAVESGKIAFGLATVENAEEEPCKIVAIPAGELEEAEAPLLEEAKRNLARLPFDEIAGLIERRFPGEEKSRRQMTISTDLVYDVLRRHQPDHRPRQPRDGRHPALDAAPPELRPGLHAGAPGRGVGRRPHRRDRRSRQSGGPATGSPCARSRGPRPGGARASRRTSRSWRAGRSP